MRKGMPVLIKAAAAFLLAAMIGASPAVSAQASAPDSSGRSSATPFASQGFSVPGMLLELSLFLPEATRPLGGAQGGGLPGGQSGSRAGAGPQGGALQAGGPRGGGGQQGGGLRSLVSDLRDPKLFFDRAQLDTLIPLMQALYQNPFPTPTSAPKLRAALEGMLTPAQERTLERFRSERDRLAARRRQEPGGQQAAGEGSLQRQPDGGGRNLTPLERRQRMIAAFSALLKQRRKELASS
jgi:hypothetical protein